MKRHLVPILAGTLSLPWLCLASPASAAGHLVAVPTELSEAQCASSVKARLIDKLGFEGFLITVSVSKETATLTGEVAKELSKGLAERVALSVKGIRKVDNQVVIGPESKHCLVDANGISTSR